MRKLIFYFLIFLSYNIYAFDYFDIKWSLGNTGIGVNWLENGININEHYLEIINIAVEHNTSRLGLEYIPVKYWDHVQKNNTNGETSLSFVNLGLYWNIINSDFLNDTINFNIEIFNNISYLFYTEEKLNTNNFIYTAGMRIGLSLPLYKGLNYFLLGGEFGYRNINGTAVFYSSIKIDFILYLMSSISSSYNY